MRNIRRLQHTQRARVEHDLTLSRIGELTERDINLLTRSLLYTLSGKKAAFIEGLIASPGAGLSVDLTAPASVIQNIGNGVLTSDVKLVTDENTDGSAFNIGLSAADPTNPRIDIIEGTIKVRSAFTDSAVDIVDATTKTITPTTRDRDFELYLELRKIDGTPAGSPIPPSTTVATAGSIVSTVAIPGTIDLSIKNILNIALGPDSEYVEIDCSGAAPVSTTVIEIRDAINAALPGSPASVDGGNHIIITCTGTGELSVVKFKQPTDPATDAYDIIMGGVISKGYFDSFAGENAYFKVAEIFVPATAVSLTADNIRSREEKDTTWDSDAATIINSLTFQGHRDSLPADHVAGSIDFSHLSSDAINQLTAIISSLGTNYRGPNAVVYTVSGDATFQKGTLFKHDEELVSAIFETQLDSDFEQEFPVYRVDQRQDDITGGSTYAVPISLSEAPGDTWSFTPGTLINDGTNYYQVQSAYGLNARIGIYIKNGGTISGFTHLEVDIHNSSDVLLGSVQISLADLQAVGIGWIYANITLSQTLTLSTTYHLHFHLIGETAPTTAQLALDISNTNLAYRQMYLPTSGKYGGANEADVLKLLNPAGTRLVGIRATGADDISSPGDGFLGIATGSNYDFFPVDFSNNTFWTNWIYEDYIGVDRDLGRIKVPITLDVREFYAEYNVFEPIGDLDAKHFLLHEVNNPTETKSIDDYLADRLDDNTTLDIGKSLYNSRNNGKEIVYLGTGEAYELDLPNLKLGRAVSGTKGNAVTFNEFNILYPGRMSGNLIFNSTSTPPTVSAGTREFKGVGLYLPTALTMTTTDALGACSQTFSDHNFSWMRTVADIDNNYYYVLSFDTQLTDTSGNIDATSNVVVTSNVAKVYYSSGTPTTNKLVAVLKGNDLNTIYGPTMGQITGSGSDGGGNFFTMKVTAADGTYNGGTYEVYYREVSDHIIGLPTGINTDASITIYSPRPQFCDELETYGLDQYGIPTTIAADIVYKIIGCWEIDGSGNTGDIISYKSGKDKNDNELWVKTHNGYATTNLYRSQYLAYIRIRGDSYTFIDSVATGAEVINNQLKKYYIEFEWRGNNAGDQVAGVSLNANPLATFASLANNERLIEGRTDENAEGISGSACLTLQVGDIVGPHVTTRAFTPSLNITQFKMTGM